jgi:Tfp pilus assembly protein PilF
MGFGDDEIAEQYFVKALSVDPDNIDSNYFYGEFLLDQDRYADAVAALRKAMAAPTDPSRPVFDAGRRKEIEALLAEAERKVS